MFSNFYLIVIYLFVALETTYEAALALFQAGLLDRLSGVMREQDEFARADAAFCYSYVALHEGMVPYLPNDRFIREIWALWDADADDYVKDKLLAAMQNISTPMHWVKPVLHAGVLPYVRHVLTVDNLDVRFVACGLLGNMTRDDDVRLELLKMDLIPSLVTLMDASDDSSDPLTSKISVFCTLRNLAVEPVAARYVAFHPEILQIILENLKRAVADAENESLFLRFVLSFAYNLSTDELSVGPLRGAGVVDVIKPLLSHPENFIRVASKLTLINIVGSQSDNDYLQTDLKFVEELVTILQCSLRNETYAELIWLLFAPLQALANLAVVPKNRPWILDSKVLDPLQQV